MVFWRVDQEREGKKHSLVAEGEVGLMVGAVLW